MILLWVCPSLILFTAGIVAFFNGINSFKRDLYSETGYLIFTLPKKVYYIINTKLFASMIEICVYGIIGGLFFISRLIKIEKFNYNSLMSLLSSHKLECLEFIIIMILGIAFVFLLAYFSLAVSRVTFGSKRYGEFLAIIIFFFFSYLIGKITFIVFD